MRTTTAALLVALAAAAFALWFFNTHHKEYTDRYVGFQGEARYNDFYAAQLLLQELGVDADSVSTLTPAVWLPAEDETLFVRLNAPMVIGPQGEALLQWVEDGGNLILLPPDSQVLETDDFLSNFGFGLLQEDDAEIVEQGEDEEPEAAATELQFDNRYEISRDWNTFDIEFFEGEASSDVIYSDDEVIVARTDYGDGFLTLLALDYHFSNYQLKNDDNARLLLDVIDGDIQPNKVWIVYDTAFRPLWAVIWQAAPYAVGAAGFLLLLWLWAAIPAFGPRVTTEYHDRRSIIEHVDASGNFVWRKAGGYNLVDAASQAILHDAAQRHPGIARESKSKQAEAIAKLTSLSPQEVADVLISPSAHRPGEFTNTIQTLQKIRKEL